MAVEVRDDNTDVWVHDLERGTQTRLTFDPGLDRFPVWTPDGERIAFSSDREGGILDIFWKLAVGTGQPELVVADPNRRLDAWSWTPDGQSLLINEGGPDIGIVTLGGDQARQPVLDEDFNEGTPEVSPDGRWMAYRSNESGRTEIFVRPFPDVAGGKWQVSTEGGNYPAWSPDGQELFYRAGDGSALMGVTVETEPTFSAGIPETIIEGDYVYAPGQGRNWDISPDGQRFLMLKDVGQAGNEDAAPPQVIIVQKLVRGTQAPCASSIALSLQPGTTLGPYEILSPIGAGAERRDRRTIGSIETGQPRDRADATRSAAVAQTC